MEPRCWSQYGSSEAMQRLGVKWPHARSGHSATCLGGEGGEGEVEGMLVMYGESLAYPSSPTRTDS